MKYVSNWILITVMIAGCNNRNSGVYAYNSSVEKELASGKKADSLFFAIKFGMTRKEFYSYCWEMHKEGQFLDGTNSTSVLYKVNKGLRSPASMNFYPEFYKDSIYKMAARFQYDAWAPWNRGLISDSLLPDVLHLYMEWYPGNEFIKMTDPQKGTIYVKVDRNRRIIVGKRDDEYVNVDYTDLLIERKIKK